jgi:DnaJ-domain-containing protein 1
MSGEIISEVLSFAPSSATLVALLAGLPVVAALYLYCRVESNRIRPDLSLGKLERLELERAVLLYGKVCRRQEELYQLRGQPSLGWRAWYRARTEFHKSFGAEVEELKSYASDLRYTITRLRNRPLERYRTRIRIISSRFALGRSLAGYCLMLASLIASSCYADPPLWAPAFSTSRDTLALWQALDGRLLLANWMAFGFTGIAMLLLYLVRRVELSREHGRQLRALKEFAAADPDRLIDRRQEDAEDFEPTTSGAEAAPQRAELRAWFSVLGVSPSASVEEVKQAYKMLLKQNHPDRVHNMSLAFRRLAESETKKLNIAYAEALASLRYEHWQGQEVTQAA